MIWRQKWFARTILSIALLGLGLPILVWSSDGLSSKSSPYESIRKDLEALRKNTEDLKALPEKIAARAANDTLQDGHLATELKGIHEEIAALRGSVADQARKTETKLREDIVAQATNNASQKEVIRSDAKALQMILRN